MERDRILVDGVFDLWHPGHANIIRQAKSRGYLVVAAINSDNEVNSTKGVFPIYTEQERGEIASACRWADEVIVGTRYNVTLLTLEQLGCSCAAHGDDIATDRYGNNSMAEILSSGKLVTLRRTIGTSTTQLKVRLVFISLLAAKKLNIEAEAVLQKLLPHLTLSCSYLLPHFAPSHPPKNDDKIVYLPDSFDIFHVCHTRMIQEAKSLGTYLIVGVYDDRSSNALSGLTVPIAPLIDKALNVLSINGVDCVLIGVPLKVTQEFINAYNISVVAHSKMTMHTLEQERQAQDLLSRALEIPGELGMLHTLSTANDSYGIIINRIQKNQDTLISLLPVELASLVHT